MTRYNFIELSFYAFNSGDTKSHLHPFTTSKALDFGGWHNFHKLLCWESLVNGCQWFVWFLLIIRLVEVFSRETGNFIKLGGGILSVLLFSCGWEVCPSQLWITSFNLWNWKKIHQSYTNHNPIWFESRPWHFPKKMRQGKSSVWKKQAIHTTANRITRGLLAGRLSAFRCADVVDWLRWTSSRDEAFMTWKSCKKRMLRIYIISLRTGPTQNEESTFPMFKSFLDSFRKTTSNLVTKISRNKQFFPQITNNQDLPHYVFKGWLKFYKCQNLETSRLSVHPRACGPTQPPLILG